MAARSAPFIFGGRVRNAKTCSNPPRGKRKPKGAPLGVAKSKRILGIPKGSPHNPYFYIRVTFYFFSYLWKLPRKSVDFATPKGDPWVFACRAAVLSRFSRFACGAQGSGEVGQGLSNFT